MRGAFVLGLALFAAGPALAQEFYNSAYVSDPAVCERAGEDDIQGVLFELNAWILAPKKGVIAAELGCEFVTQQTISRREWGEELLSTTRCYGHEIDFVDQTVIAADSGSINADFGDQPGEPVLGDTLNVLSLRTNAATDEWENYAGLYRRCDALTEWVDKWFD